MAYLAVLSMSFNEAAGFTQRKLAGSVSTTKPRPRCFNEAAGFTQRKHHDDTYPHDHDRASMRPPVLPSGNPV